MSVLISCVVALVLGGGTLVNAPQHVITQKGRVFAPGSMTIKAGEEVVFQNDDTVSHHTYSATKGYEFNLETMKPGQKGSRPFAKAGRVDVRCGLHPGMRLILIVE
jgi:plastocyanin